MKKREWKRKERLYREEIWNRRKELRVSMKEDMDAETLVDEEWEEVGGQDEA